MPKLTASFAGDPNAVSGFTIMSPLATPANAWRLLKVFMAHLLSKKHEYSRSGGGVRVGGRKGAPCAAAGRLWRGRRSRRRRGERGGRRGGRLENRGAGVWFSAGVGKGARRG